METKLNYRLNKLISECNKDVSKIKIRCILREFDNLLKCFKTLYGANIINYYDYKTCKSIINRRVKTLEIRLKNMEEKGE